MRHVNRPISMILCLVVLAIATPCMAADNPKPPVPPEAAPEAAVEIGIQTAPVTLDGTVLFRVRGVSAFPAAQRAAAIAGRIESLADDAGFNPETLDIIETPHSADIVAGTTVVVAVLDADARLEAVQRQPLAQIYLSRIRSAIDTYRREHSRQYLTTQTFKALGLTAAFFLIVALLVRLTRRFDILFESRYKRRIQSVGIQSFQILQAGRIWSTLRGLLRSVRAVAVAVLSYLYLSSLLGLFPWTRPLSNRLLDYVVGPLRTMGRAMIAYLPNLFFLVILVLVSRYVLKMLRLFFEAVRRGTVTLTDFEREWAQPTYRIARVIVIAFAVVVAYPYIPGSDSAAFQGVSIFLGVLFSLGSSSVIANIIAGYTMTYRRAFKVGDRVKIDETIGDVTEMRLLVTHMRSLKNEEIVIPNSIILSSQIVNYSALADKHGLILHTTVGIGYEVPWRQVEEMLRIAADRTPGLLKGPAPFVLHASLGDFSVNYELNAYCNDAGGMVALYTALHRNILDIFNEHGVQIMTPAYENDPEQPKIVPKGQWYAAPAMQTESTSR